MKINSYKEFCLFQNVSRETYEKFIIFHKTLIKWQNSINLISKNTIESIWEIAVGLTLFKISLVSLDNPLI